MTRRGRPSRELADLFGADQYAAVVQVVREAGSGVTAVEIKRSLDDAGVSVQAPVWTRVQRRLRSDDHIVVEPGSRYRWAVKPPRLSAVEAFELIERTVGAG